MRETKQVIVIRKDLKMRRGKEIAQGSHASMAFLTKQYPSILSEAVACWMKNSFAKVCLQVNSEQELDDIAAAAEQAGLVCHVITDSG
jgi:PTH2 family peptidyl-tRNA hydrolase